MSDLRPEEAAIFSRLIELLADQNVKNVDVRSLPCDDTHFRELGIESMTMIRWVGAIEDEYDIEIDTSDALIAFSFVRLVRLIDERTNGGDADPKAEPANLTFARTQAAACAATYEVPEGTLLQVMTRRAEAVRDTASLTFRSLRGADVKVTHETLLKQASWLSEQLPVIDTAAQPHVLVIVGLEPYVMLQSFLAGLMAGMRPLILPPPRSLGGAESMLNRLASLHEAMGDTCTFALQSDLELGGDVAGTVVRVPGTAADFGVAEQIRLEPAGTSADDIAFLQSTGGSTGEGKLVAVTHSNALSNLAALKAGMLLGDDERLATWLPLYHDMGLLGGTLFPMVNGYSAIIFKPTDFIKKPLAWIEAMSEIKATFGGCPNFALDYAAMMVPPAALEGLDLSSLRRFGVAAEPITPNAMQAFVDRFAPSGLNPDIMMPGLGMAEATIAATTRPGAGGHYAVLASSAVEIGGEVKLLTEADITYPAQEMITGGVPVFALGWALPEMQVGLIDDSGRGITEDRVMGEITVTGPSIVGGYYDPATHTSSQFPSGVHLSGDLGFFHEGDLYVVGRRKNVLIRNGANYVASMLENEVARVFGVSPVTVMVVDEDINDPSSGVVAIVEANGSTSLTDEQRKALRSMELPIDTVHFCMTLAIPRTTSAKKKYHAARAALVEGSLPITASVSTTGEGQ